MRPVVTFTVNNRPDYLRETLASWEQVRGIESALLLFRCEPGCPEAVSVCRAVSFAETRVTVSPGRLGVLRAPWQAFEDGFAESRFVILAEDDLTVSQDVLEFFAWCQRYENDSGVLGVTTYQHDAQPGGLAGVRTADWSDDDRWHFWVWGTWRDRWDAFLYGDWDFDYSHRGWDWRIRDHWVRRGLRMMAPSAGRSQHIGKYGGSHCTPAQFASLRSPSFTPSVPPQQYREMPW